MRKISFVLGVFFLLSCEQECQEKEKLDFEIELYDSFLNQQVKRVEELKKSLERIKVESEYPYFSPHNHDSLLNEIAAQSDDLTKTQIAYLLRDADSIQGKSECLILQERLNRRFQLRKLLQKSIKKAENFKYMNMCIVEIDTTAR